ncbi:hypothetical protein ACHAXH_008321 [Discostella pseudostelligera]
MNDSNETTASTPSEPKLCKMACGFFGSNATGDCCSKCWNELRKKQGATATPAAAANTATATPHSPSSTTTAPVITTTAVTADDATTSAIATAPSFTTTTDPVAATASPAKKKKTKKTSYKNMLAGMMEGSGPRDVTKDKESIQKVTGGGAFVKVDKI